MGGISACVPPKYRMHIASVAPLRASPLLCALLHSLADLTSSLLSRACQQATQVPHLCCLLMCRDASRMTRGTAFVIPPPWAPSCSTRSATGMASQLTSKQGFPTETPILCTWAQFCCQMSFALIFHARVEQQSKCKKQEVTYVV